MKHQDTQPEQENSDPKMPVKRPDHRPELLTLCLLCAVAALILTIVRQAMESIGWLTHQSGGLIILLLLGLAVVFGAAGIRRGKHR